MTTTTDRSWLTKGTRVAILRTDRGKATAVEIRTVARTTATQLVLDNDERWRLKDLRPVGDSQRDSWSLVDRHLLPVDDPRVVAVRAGIALRNLGRTVEPWLNGQRTYVDDPAAALALLDQVVQAVADTRTRVARLAGTDLTAPASTEDRP